jgi:cytoskeleton protein RodZ
MSDEVSQAPAAAGPTAGQLLRQAREAAGLHVATLAVALKVPVRKLEALEEDRYDLLPDAVFVRALASSVCRTLKIDAQAILERLPQTAAPRLVRDDDGINAPFRAPGDGPGQHWLQQVSRPVVLTVFALLLGAVVLIFLPARYVTEQVAASSKADPVMPPASAVVNPAATEAAPATESPPAPVTPVVAPAPGAPVVALAAPAPAAAAASAASVPAVTASTSTGGTATTTLATAPATPASGLVTFRTKADSWIKVTDAKGTTVLQKLMTAGDSAGASGTLPLTVTVGSVQATEVEVRGQPFNLAPVAHDNVARFEIK